jgi:hypothetical protein
MWRTLLIGYFGSVGIATLSDSLIPYAGEVLLGLPHRGLHLGLIEKWWVVNPLALAGTALAYVRPKTKFPHAGHVLLSTWASLFHITMALGTDVTVSTAVLIAAFLFLAPSQSRTGIPGHSARNKPQGEAWTERTGFL